MKKPSSSSGWDDCIRSQTSWIPTSLDISSIIMIFTSKRSFESSSCFRSFSEKSKGVQMPQSEFCWPSMNLNFFLNAIILADRRAECWILKRLRYLEDHELSGWQKSWTLPLFSFSCVSVETVQCFVQWRKKKSIQEHESHHWCGYECFTLRTFIAFSSFFLFLDVFFPVENLTFRSRTVVPSAWHRRQIINQETIVSLTIIW